MNSPTDSSSLPHLVSKTKSLYHIISITQSVYYMGFIDVSRPQRVYETNDSPVLDRQRPKMLSLLHLEVGFRRNLCSANTAAGVSSPSSALYHS